MVAVLPNRFRHHQRCVRWNRKKHVHAAALAIKKSVPLLCQIRMRSPQRISFSLKRSRQTFFQRLLRASGFGEEADKAEQSAGGAAFSDRVLDAICLIGPVALCRERLAAYREAGLDLPILWPAMGIDSAREVIAAFRQ